MNVVQIETQFGLFDIGLSLSSCIIMFNFVTKETV